MMQWFKKISKVELKEEEPQLVDQPFQMLEKTNEELLAELKLLVRVRLKTKWISPAMWWLYLLGTFGGILYYNYASIQFSFNPAWNHEESMRQLDVHMGVMSRNFLLAYTLPNLLFAVAPIAGYYRSKLNSERIGLLVSELARRKETALMLIISELSKVGNASFFDKNRLICFLATLQLTPYLSRQEFEQMSWEGQGRIIGILNHIDPEVRLNTQNVLIRYGNKLTLKTLKNLHNFSYSYSKDGLNALEKFCSKISRADLYPIRILNRETVKDFKANITRCVEGIEARMKEEEAEAQLLRPSSSKSDRSELLRAAQGVGVDEKHELLLWPSSALPGELSTTEIAAKFQPKVAEESIAKENVSGC